MVRVLGGGNTPAANPQSPLGGGVLEDSCLLAIDGGGIGSFADLGLQLEGRISLANPPASESEDSSLAGVCSVEPLIKLAVS